ncbi:hypothetical protein B0H66DRAFT_552919 [Apodospora peruviana]|uniref:DUF7907 domain-containing protein n=1 Tax=Apodospora peruviana TaxID=516989 RepID=A0AAE0M7Z8_9PEZI|nr:hypothetical protein B0H66DRAFT_552919 [Apodospora peruviana]
MLTATLLLTLLLGTNASPILTTRQKTPLDYPPRKMAKAFTLVANITDLSKPDLFDAPVNHWYLAGVHVGAGRDAAILRADTPLPGAVFFINGTGQDISSQSTTVAMPPIAGAGGGGTNPPTPQSLQFTKSESDGRIYVGLNFGRGTVGSGIGVGLRDPYARLFSPFGASFIVCHEPNPTVGRPQHAVFGIEYGALVPENCVGMNLLAQCAELPPLAGEEELHIVNEGVGCYEDVKAIDWSKW